MKKITKKQIIQITVGVIFVIALGALTYPSNNVPNYQIGLLKKQADTIKVITCINMSNKTKTACDSCWDVVFKK
jgi:hypothetical protein